MIVTNEATENQLTNLTFESNDVIIYLKKLVEEKDEEVREELEKKAKNEHCFRLLVWKKCWKNREKNQIECLKFIEIILN